MSMHDRKQIPVHLSQHDLHPDGEIVGGGIVAVWMDGSEICFLSCMLMLLGAT